MLALSSLFIKTGDDDVELGPPGPQNPDSSDDETGHFPFDALMDEENEELGVGDLTIGFTDAFERILDADYGSRTFYFQQCGIERLRRALASKYELEQLFCVYDETGTPSFLLGKSKTTGSRRIQYLILVDGHMGRLTFTKQDCLGLCYEAKGAGLLDFKQRRIPVIGNYTLFDKYKTLLRVNTHWYALWRMLPLCASSKSYQQQPIIYENLDGTPTGWLKMCVEIPGQVSNEGEGATTVGIEFIPSLNQKAKFMMIAAALAPCVNYFWQPGRRKYKICVTLIHIVVVLLAIGAGFSIYLSFVNSKIA